MLFVVAWLVSPAGPQLRAGQARRPPHQQGQRPRAACADFRAGVWMRRCCATRPPASCTRSSTSASSCLFIVTVVLEIDHQLPDVAEVPARPHVPGATRSSPTSSASCSLVGIVWAIARRYVQRPYRIRIKTKPEDARHPRARSSSSRVTGFLTEALRIALRAAGPQLREVVVRRLAALRRSSTAGRSAALHDAHRWSWVVHVVAFLAFLVILPTTKLRHMITSPMNMYLKDTDRPKGAMKPMPNLMETELETFGAVDGRGLHLEAALRHRRVHDLRPLHVGVPGARDRQAARPARDRAEGRRGDGRHRRSPVSRRRSAPTPRSRITADIAVRADHVRRAVGVHDLQGVRRDLPGQHRDPRQDPRHAPLPLAHGERLPGRARQHVPLDGEHRQRLRHEPGRARRLGRRASRASRSSTPAATSTTSTSTGSAARARSTTATRRRAARSRSCCSGRTSTSRSSARASCAPATPPAARATSTSSRCSRCRTSRRSTASA